MGAFTQYALQVALLLAAFSVLYRLTLSSATFHRFNRAVLMCGIALSFIIVPMISPEAEESAESAEAQVTAMRAEVDSLSESPMPVWPKAVALVYLAGVAVAAVATLRSALAIARIIRAGRKEPSGSHTIVFTKKNDISPFSWGRYIIVPEGTAPADLHMIVEHEKCHLRHRHWVDLAIAQCTVVFNWFNPAAYMLMREIQDVHEYQVDAEILAQGHDARQYQLLLLRNAVGSAFPRMANGLSHSRLKARIGMMARRRPASRRAICAVVIIPLLFGVASAVEHTPLSARLASVGNAMIAGTPANGLSYLIGTDADGNEIHGISYVSAYGDTNVSMTVPQGSSSPKIYINRHIATRADLSAINADAVDFVLADNTHNRFVVKTK